MAAQLWIFEHPTSVIAKTPVNITWAPHTFNSVNYGDFPLNLWLLRADNKTDKVIKSYPPYRLAYNQSVYNNWVLWLPTLDDVDSNEVAQAGWTQLAWEETKDNRLGAADNTTFQGWSQGFHVSLPVSGSTSTSTSSFSSSSSSSSASSATSSLPSASSTSTSSSTPTSSPTTTSLPTATASLALSTSSAAPQKSSASMTALDAGLGVALGLLFVIGIGAVIWGVRKYRRKKKENLVELPAEDHQWQAKDMYTPMSSYGHYKPVGPPTPPRELDVRKGSPEAVEMPANMP